MKIYFCLGIEGTGRRDIALELYTLFDQIPNKVTIIAGAGRRDSGDVTTDKVFEDIDYIINLYEADTDYLIFRFVGWSHIDYINEIYARYKNTCTFVLFDKADTNGRNFNAVSKNSDVLGSAAAVLAKIAEQETILNTFLTTNNITWTTTGVPSFNPDLTLIPAAESTDLTATRLIAILDSTQ
jgi:hypothetical protein